MAPLSLSGSAQRDHHRPGRAGRRPAGGRQSSYEPHDLASGGSTSGSRSSAQAQRGRYGRGRAFCAARGGRGGLPPRTTTEHGCGGEVFFGATGVGRQRQRVAYDRAGGAAHDDVAAADANLDARRPAGSAEV